MSSHADTGATVAVRIVDEGWSRALPTARAVAGNAARAALRAAAREHPATAEVSIALADDSLLARLNREWRGVEGATNVLAFPGGPAGAGHGGEAGCQGPPVVLGDVVLARETIAAEAVAQHKSLAAHTSHLVVHGVLHLLGHHHRTEGEAGAMAGMETRILATLGIADPHLGPRGGGRN